MPRTDQTPDLDELLAELARVRGELDALRSQLEHQERLATLGTIAGLIAHEFNNILTPVMSYAQMAAASPQDHELAAKAVVRAAKGSERASKIASAILGFARDDGQTLRTPCREFHEEQPVGCSVQAVLDETLACLARDPERDGIRLELDVQPGLQAAIRPVALQHVLLNLILNARNAMIPGGGQLTIRAQLSKQAPEAAVGELDTGRSSMRNGEWVVVAVEDTGRGMSPEQLGRLFTPFVTTSEGERRGTGLGMTICKRLIEDCGGWMLVGSTIGSGTTMRVIVPMHH